MFSFFKKKNSIKSEFELENIKFKKENKELKEYICSTLSEGIKNRLCIEKVDISFFGNELHINGYIKGISKTYYLIYHINDLRFLTIKKLSDDLFDYIRNRKE